MHKSIAILQHTALAAPGQLLAVLDQLALPWRLYSLAAGDALPTDLESVSGLIMLGGAMSANDTADWLVAEQALVLAAYKKGIPLVGHCLGAQILSKALGAVVKPNPQKEIGWFAVEPVNLALAQEWFGPIDNDFMVFQWHGDTFELPKGALQLLKSTACQNQAYVIDGKHLAMQFHLEMTPELIEHWLSANQLLLLQEHRKNSLTVSSALEMTQGIDLYMEKMHGRLLQVYARWAKNLKVD